MTRRAKPTALEQALRDAIGPSFEAGAVPAQVQAPSTVDLAARLAEPVHDETASAILALVGVQIGRPLSAWRVSEWKTAARVLASALVAERVHASLYEDAGASENLVARLGALPKKRGRKPKAQRSPTALRTTLDNWIVQRGKGRPSSVDWDFLVNEFLPHVEAAKQRIAVESRRDASKVHDTEAVEYVRRAFSQQHGHSLYDAGDKVAFDRARRLLAKARARRDSGDDPPA